jgi:uncharacterized protein (TIGR03000 family)
MTHSIIRNAILGQGLVLLLAGWAQASSTDGTTTTTTTTTRTIIRIYVPAKAEVFVGEARTRSKGEERVFISPPLVAGQRYSYEVRVVHEGRTVKQTVRFTGGGKVEVDFRPELRKPPPPTQQEKKGECCPLNSPFKPLHSKLPRTVRV